MLEILDTAGTVHKCFFLTTYLFLAVRYFFEKGNKFELVSLEVLIRLAVMVLGQVEDNFWLQASTDPKIY